MVKKNKWPLTLSAFAFITSIVIGFFIGQLFGIEPGNQIVSSGDVSLPTTSFYFINNIRVVLLLFTGIITFGVTTILILFQNGAIIGLTVSTSTKLPDPFELLILIIPHSFVELPAIIVAGAAGVKIPTELVKYILNNKKSPFSKKDIYYSIILFVIAIILIYIAAVIESTTTIKFYNLYY